MGLYKTFISFAVLFLAAVSSFAQEGTLLSKPYTPGKRSGSIEYFLREITRQTGIDISYSSATIDPGKKVRLKHQEQPVKVVLETILAGQRVKIMERNGKILIMPEEDRPPAGQCTLNGFIRDHESKEVLIGAYIIIPATGQGTVTNNFGFYSITLPSGNYKVFISYIGYRTDTFDLDLRHDQRKDIQLDLQSPLTEVSVSGKEKIESPGDHIHLSLNDITSHQALLGETDVMRALQHVPGVQSGIDGTSGIQVRGGDPGQNLNLLDGTPLYYIDHFFGVTSVYNTEAIKSVDFHKGAFPSRYGGRLSSIIDVHTRDGNMERLGGQFTLGLVKSSLNLEAPLIKNKASVFLSGRRTWVDGLWRPFADDQLGVDFYDINVKANYILNKNNRLYVSFYNGRDQIRVNVDQLNMRVRWSNTLASARWSTVITPKLFLSTTATYSLYRFELKNVGQLFENGKMTNTGDYNGISKTNDMALRMQANWYPTPGHSVQYGVYYSHANFTPTSVEYTNKQVQSGNTGKIQEIQSNEIILFAEDEIKVIDKWLVRAGLHWASWFSETYNYTSLQPRLYTSYKLHDRHLLYASFSNMAQFLHLVNNNTYGLPTDFWVPSTERIKPERSLLGTIGYAGKAGKHFEYNVEGYYKAIDGVTVYTSGRDLFDNSNRWQDKVIQGKGWSYGAELSAQQQVGKFHFSLAYTLSWNWRQFATINGGEKFPYRYDRRHNLKVSVIYKPGKKTDIGADWTYMSGEAITLPDHIYPDLDNNLMVNSGSSLYSTNYTYSYAGWNDYRLPAIHRLDIGANFRRYRGRHYIRTWSLGVFNAYGRPNVMFVNLTQEESGIFKLKGICLLTYVPYISYKINF